MENKKEKEEPSSITSLESFSVYSEIYDKDVHLIRMLFTKECGYTFLAYFIRQSVKLKDIYKYVSEYFSHVPEVGLYLDKEYKVKVENSEELLKDYIVRMNLHPVYPMPERVVYRFFFDDGRHPHN